MVCEQKRNQFRSNIRFLCFCYIQAYIKQRTNSTFTSETTSTSPQTTLHKEENLFENV